MRSSSSSIRVFVALCIGTLIAIVYSLARNDALPPELLVIGDLPGFYGLGRLVLEGQGHNLFDIELQREVQNRFWPAMSGKVLFTLYPPFVAGIVSLVAWMPPRILQCLIASALTALLIWSVREESEDRCIERLSLTLFSLPVLLSIVGIQNTSLSIALIVVTRKLLRDRRDLAAGLVAGALLYKPHVGLLFIALVAVSAHFNFIRGVVITAILEYVVGYAITGDEWLSRWMTEIRSFSSARAGVDGYQMTSVLQALDSVPSSAWGILGLVISFSLFCRFSFVNRHQPEVAARVIDLFLLTFPILVPQTMFYDLGISLFILFTRISLGTTRSLSTAVLVVLVLNVCVWSREAPRSFVPFAALLVGGYALIAPRASPRPILART